MIAGVDSGTWRAFAVLDFDGNVVAMESRKNWTPDEFIASLSAFPPAVIACDKIPVPKNIRLLKSVFSARLFKPHKSLTGVQKTFLTRDYRIANEHERDALAAALKAFRSLKNKFELVDKKAGNAGIPLSRRALLKRLVLKGETVEKALRLVKATG
ncbi:MAG: DUF460 domain-containing protein [Candidatus Norongarragalinales archaeon]